MNLVFGEVAEVFREDGALMGKIKVRNATQKIALGLLTDVVRGDTVLICDGVAISKVAEPQEREKKHVSGDPRETH